MLCQSETTHLPDVLLGILPPQLIIFVIEAHERQHTPGEQGTDVGLHTLPGC